MLRLANQIMPSLCQSLLIILRRQFYFILMTTFIRIVELNVEAKCAMKGCNEKNNIKAVSKPKAWLTLG